MLAYMHGYEKLAALDRSVGSLSDAHRVAWDTDSMTVDISEDCVIDPSVRIFGEGIRIGSRTKIYRGGELLGPVDIGSAVFINRDAYIRPNTTIGDRVNLGPFVRLITDAHEIGPASRRAGAVRYDPITIGAGTWIGAAATVLGGVSIGAGAVVAAGAVVVSDVPANTVVAGVPARVVRALDVPTPGNDQRKRFKKLSRRTR